MSSARYGRQIGNYAAVARGLATFVDLDERRLRIDAAACSRVTLTTSPFSSQLEPNAVTRLVQSALTAVDPGIAVTQPQTMETVVAQTLGQARLIRASQPLT